jgi:hypothetical protein
MRDFTRPSKIPHQDAGYKWWKVRDSDQKFFGARSAGSAFFSKKFDTVLWATLFNETEDARDIDDPSLRALAKQSRATQRGAGRVAPGLLRKGSQ